MQIEKRSVSQLSNDPANARKHSERNIQAIIGSLRRFGMQKPLVIDSSGVVRAGNGTLEAARQLGWETIDCVVTDLKGSDAIAYAIADNRTAELAEWDDDVLAAQLNGLLADDEELLEAAGFSEEDLEALLADSEIESENDDNPYTNKIVTPIYEPKGDKPSIDTLIDRTKTNQLQSEIEAANLPNDVKQFLKDAAERHTVFNFRQIAEYYCHADATLQDLMERSGLVIIDFDKAIQYGFVHLTERLGQLADFEEADDGNA
jgi:hypothetical protein